MQTKPGNQIREERIMLGTQLLKKSAVENCKFVLRFPADDTRRERVAVGTKLRDKKKELFSRKPA